VTFLKPELFFSFLFLSSSIKTEILTLHGFNNFYIARLAVFMTSPKKEGTIKKRSERERERKRAREREREREVG
jgi:hypothetical protein